MISESAKNIIDIAVNALEDKKANNIKRIDISSISIISDAIVIASGSNVNQIKAMSDEIEEKLSKSGYKPLSIEGYDKANWILLDYNDVVFHLFDEENRSFYNLERLYVDCSELS